MIKKVSRHDRLEHELHMSYGRRWNIYVIYT